MDRIAAARGANVCFRFDLVELQEQLQEQQPISPLMTGGTNAASVTAQHQTQPEGMSSFASNYAKY